MVDFSTEELANLEANHKYGFPGYRVFIFGHEVTEDVIEVRVNNSGGSVDRSPGSCSITLSNKDNRYTLNHYDMKAIALARKKLKANIDKSLKETQDDSYVAIKKAYEENQKQIENIKSNDPDAFIDGGMYDGEYSAILEVYSKDGVANFENDQYTEFPVQWFNDSVSDVVKKSVLDKKMKWKAAVKPKKDIIFTRFDYDMYYQYPFQEGDCIFHSNDMVRIVFQDPFDPRQKWWMFSGFVDSSTNDTGINEDSKITITCTDVSKMPRYALIQLNTGILDDDIKRVLNIDEGISSSGVQAYKELFAEFTVIEALETLFFGSQSLIDKYEKFHDKVAAFVSSMSPEEIRIYLLENTDMTTIEVDDMVYGAKIKNSQDPDEWQTIISSSEAGLAEARNKVMSIRYEDIINRLYNTRIDAIQAPNGHRFTRKNNELGIHAYFMGTPNTDDLMFGDQIKDLEWWNDLINHRVKLEDIRDMSVKDGKSIKYGTTIDQVITEIGTNIEDYPVGGGKVYYLAPARLGEYLDRTIIDRTPTSSVEFHSEFKDKLSYIYSMADIIDFRFYATPKGDVIFEMPFYPLVSLTKTVAKAGAAVFWNGL